MMLEEMRTDRQFSDENAAGLISEVRLTAFKIPLPDAEDLSANEDRSIVVFSVGKHLLQSLFMRFETRMGSDKPCCFHSYLFVNPVRQRVATIQLFPPLTQLTLQRSAKASGRVHSCMSPIAIEPRPRFRCSPEAISQSAEESVGWTVWPQVTGCYMLFNQFCQPP